MLESRMAETDVQHHPLLSSPKPLVYVVDDDAAVLGSLRFLLEADGFAVRTFRNGSALLNARDDSAADCYVIDYKMPDINGIDLAARLRKCERCPPVILITGYPDENISARAAVAGVRDVVLKPLLEENLIRRIRLAMAHKPCAPLGK